MKNKNDGYKKIKSLFYIVAIISMIIAIFGKVSAQELPEELQEQIIDILDNDLNIAVNQSYLDSCFSCPYCAVYNINNGSHNIYFFDFYFTKNIGYLYQRYGGRYYYATSMYFEYTGSNRGYISCSPAYDGTVGTGYRIIVDNTSYYFGSVTATSSNVVQSTDYNITGLPSTYSDMYGYNIYSNSTSSYTYNVLISYGNCYLQNGGNFAVHEDTWEPVTVDDNFIIYKSYGVGGISDPLLNIQYADDIFSQGYTYTSSTIYNLTFDVDGTETTVSISSSAYPDDFFENGSFRTSFDLIYRMLSNKIVNFSSADTVTLTAVSMSAIAYPTSNMQGTPETITKSTLCNLVLKGSQGSTDIESEVIAPITDITTTFDQVYNSTDFINQTGSNYYGITLPSWADIFTICIHERTATQGWTPPFECDWVVPDYVFSESEFLGMWTTTNTFDSNSISIGGESRVTDSNGNSTLILNKRYVVDVLNYLKLVDSVDIVRVIYVDPNLYPNNNWVHSDFIFYNSSYFQKLTIKGIGNVQSAVESGTYYTKSLYWYLKQRLDNMSDNIAEYEEKALSNQVVGNGYLQSINTNIISIKDSIDTGVNSIVSAISGISGGSSSYSLPSLSAELQRLFIPSLTWQSIDFDEYMDSLGVLSLPFSFTNDVLDIADNSYSSTLDLHINDFSLDVTGNNDILTIFEDQDYTFNPRSIFANDVWTMLTYLNAFALILGEAWITYCHIFRRGMQNDC